MTRIVVVMLALCSCAASAEEIYRWENQEGGVIYSDQPPPPNADGGRVEPEELPQLHVVPALEVPVGPTEPQSKDKDKGREATRSYERFSIVQPQANSSLRANDGSVTIALDLRPGLWVAAGHSVHLYLDGSQVAQGAQSSFPLINLERGTHTVRAEIQDRDGNTLISTNTISFSLQRYSRLF